jgi:chemotaxis signal transduction protein
VTPTAYVRVRVGDEHYALDVDHVLEIIKRGMVTPVPGSRVAMLGVHVLRGEVIAAADLATLLGIAHDAQPSRLVVAVAGDGRRASLAVDEVIGVGELDAMSHLPEGDFVPATAMADGALIGVLDVAALFDAIAGEAPS